MLGNLLVVAAGATLIAWGGAHIAPTRAVVRSVPALSLDDRRILTMEWVAEGLALIFAGALALVVTASAGADDPLARRVLWSVAGLLVVMAAWTAVTGGRTSIVAIRVCPLVKTACAALLVAGTLV